MSHLGSDPNQKGRGGGRPPAYNSGLADINEDGSFSQLPNAMPPPYGATPIATANWGASQSPFSGKKSGGSTLSAAAYGGNGQGAGPAPTNAVRGIPGVSRGGPSSVMSRSSQAYGSQPSPNQAPAPGRVVGHAGEVPRAANTVANLYNGINRASTVVGGGNVGGRGAPQGGRSRAAYSPTPDDSASQIGTNGPDDDELELVQQVNQMQLVPQPYQLQTMQGYGQQQMVPYEPTPAQATGDLLSIVFADTNAVQNRTMTEAEYASNPHTLSIIQLAQAKMDPVVVLDAIMGTQTILWAEPAFEAIIDHGLTDWQKKAFNALVEKWVRGLQAMPPSVREQHVNFNAESLRNLVARVSNAHKLPDRHLCRREGCERNFAKYDTKRVLPDLSERHYREVMMRQVRGRGDQLEMNVLLNDFYDSYYPNPRHYGSLSYFDVPQYYESPWFERSYGSIVPPPPPLVRRYHPSMLRVVATVGDRPVTMFAWL